MKLIDIAQSPDGAKFLWQLEDGNTVESAFFKSIFASRQVCISTQIGCSVGCSFCSVRGRPWAEPGLNPD
jgi:adenine C2-methylase RlmN of 23S rRNA A2503 and tRNA A37